MESLPHTGMGCARRPRATERRSSHGSARCLAGTARPTAAETLPCSRRPGPAWSRSARPLTGFAGRQIRAARTAASDDAGWFVLVKDLQQLGTAVGLKRPPRIAGKTDRIGRPRPPADLDHDVRNVRSPGDLPTPTARTGTRTHAPAQVRTDLPAHQCETTTTHTAPGEPGQDDPWCRPAGRAAPPSPAWRHAGSPEIRSQSMTQPGRRRAQVPAVRRVSIRSSGDSEPRQRIDLRDAGRTSQRSLMPAVHRCRRLAQDRPCDRF